MRTIKSKKKQFELAERGLLFFIEEGRYVRTNVGVVVSWHGQKTFYARGS